MTPRLVLALVRRGGVALLAAVALGWWVYYSDRAYRTERAASESSFREERKEERETFARALAKVAEDCLRPRGKP